MANGEHLQVPGHHGLEAGRLYLLSTKLSENNSLNPLVMKKLPSTLSMAGADGSKLVLLSAVGTVFCCGLDFVHFIRCLTDDRKWESARMAEAIRSFVNTFIQFRKLIIVAVNGPANGLEHPSCLFVTWSGPTKRRGSRRPIPPLDRVQTAVPRSCSPRFWEEHLPTKCCSAGGKVD